MDFKGLEDFTNSWWPITISFFISIIGAIRLYAGGTKCPNETRLDGKVAIITGGASGIGLNTARELARRGAQIIIACRDDLKGEEAVKDIRRSVITAKVVSKTLDVASLTSIRQFAKEIIQEYPKIDILINNAGIIFHQHHITSDNLELTFVTNYLAPFLLSHLLLPVLNKSSNGRIINLCATAHKLATITVDNLDFSQEFLYRTAFGHTKLALMLFTKHFSRLLKVAGKSITVNAVNPGLVRGTNHLKMSPLGNSWMVRVSTLPWTWLFLKSPKQGAQSIVYVATDRKFEKATGEYISDCEPERPNDLVNDIQLLEEIYQKSCKLAGINPLTK